MFGGAPFHSPYPPIQDVLVHALPSSRLEPHAAASPACPPHLPDPCRSHGPRRAAQASTSRRPQDTACSAMRPLCLCRICPDTARSNLHPAPGRQALPPPNITRTRAAASALPWHLTPSLLHLRSLHCICRACVHARMRRRGLVALQPTGSIPACTRASAAADLAGKVQGERDSAAPVERV